MLNLGTVNVIKINKIINLLNKVSRSKVKVAYKEILNSKNPGEVLKNAVRRMLKKGPLSRQQLKNLYLYLE